MIQNHNIIIYYYKYIKRKRKNIYNFITIYTFFICLGSSKKSYLAQ